MGDQASSSRGLLLVAGGLAGLLSVGGALWYATRDASEAEARAEAEAEKAEESRKIAKAFKTRKRADFQLPNRRRIETGAGERVEQDNSQHFKEVGELDSDEALETFETVLAEMDDLIGRDRRLGDLEHDHLYNRATGAYESLLNHVDATDPAQRVMLDDAHAQMMSRMRELGMSRPQVDEDPVRRRTY